MRAGILDGLLVLRGKPLHESARSAIVDNAVVLGKQEEHWHRDIRGHEAEIAVEADAFNQKTRRRFTQAERVVADELLPVRRGGKQLRVVQRNGEQTPGTDQARPQDRQPLAERWSHFGTETRT